MPIRREVYAGETDPLVFPLTVNGLPFDLSGVTDVQIVWAGWDGKLAATVSSGSTVDIASTLEGLVQWNQSAANLDARYGPYRVYFRVLVSGATYVTCPQGDYFLIDVHDNLV